MKCPKCGNDTIQKINFLESILFRELLFNDYCKNCEWSSKLKVM